MQKRENLQTIKNIQTTKIVGILNVTPDSFYDGGNYLNHKKAIEHAIQLIQEGADILDIGAESSRPGAEMISTEEELARLLPVIKTIKEHIIKNKLTVLLSVDTYKAKVAEECLKLGVEMINDITGLQDDAMAKIIAKYNAFVVIMHMQGTPQTMQKNPVYDDIIAEIKRFFAERVIKAKKLGIAKEKIILDPGIGFGKTPGHNLTILNNLEQFISFGYPIYIGISRKSFLGKITGAVVKDRLAATIAMNTVALLKGGQYLRVHDVLEHKQTLEVLKALENKKDEE